MNAHTEITHDASALAVFWRKGRKQFVPLTAPEAEAAGLGAAALILLHKSGLVEAMPRTSRKGPLVWRITDAGIIALQSAPVVEHVSPAPRPLPHRHWLTEAKSKAKFARLLSELALCPHSNRTLSVAAGIGRTATSDGVTDLVDAGFATRQRIARVVGMIADWTVITITDAGREWLEKQEQAQ